MNDIFPQTQGRVDNPVQNWQLNNISTQLQAWRKKKNFFQLSSRAQFQLICVLEPDLSRSNVTLMFTVYTDIPVNLNVHKLHLYGFSISTQYCSDRLISDTPSI